MKRFKSSLCLTAIMGFSLHANEIPASFVYNLFYDSYLDIPHYDISNPKMTRAAAES